jgi:hypothetical protein
LPDLHFSVDKAQPVRFAAAPMLHFTLRLTEAENQSVHAIALRCQIRIDPARWGQTLKSLLWTHAAVVVPPFDGTTTVDLPVPCSTDFNLAASKYFYALEDGEVPLTLLFSGTVFYKDSDQSLQIAQIPWDKDVRFKLPVSVWKEMMDHYYPNSAWLCLHKDAFDRLYQFKSRNGLTSWEAAIEKLLNKTDEQVPT